MDEARYGLKPILREVWAPTGQRPVAVQKPAYEWTYLYGFVRPHFDDALLLMLPRVNTPIFGVALQELAQSQGVGEKKRIVLVLDQAGWHTSGALVVPEGIHLVFQPPKSPQVQPSEQIWQLINPGVANRLFLDIETFETRLEAQCRKVLENRPALRARVSYHWWPTGPSQSIIQ